MRVLLATGIYPPDVGGPATYASHLAKELNERGEDVSVMTYGVSPKSKDISSKDDDSWEVVRVSKSGGPLMRWIRYAKVLKKHAADADIVYAFSSVSCGMPLWIARLKKPKKVLRLGGDFFWERYTDRGGRKTLRDWYKKQSLLHCFIASLLHSFDHIVFSTRFQEKIYEENYKKLPEHSVIENAQSGGLRVQEHQLKDPLRLLAFCRLVRFKNLEALIHAVVDLPDTLLTIVGEGPEKKRLQKIVESLDLGNRIAFATPVHGREKQKLFALHDLLVVPSLTDISPNAALEARACGLPVLLTEETGLSEKLTKGMILRNLRTPEAIAEAIREVQDEYPDMSHTDLSERSWKVVCDEHLSLFRSLI